MIASRRVDRLAAAVTELRAQLPQGSNAEVDYVQCNIRDEEQVC